MVTGKYLFVFALLIGVLASPVYSGTFQQDSGSDGIVSMEAENYYEKAAGSGKASGISWASTTSPASYSGSGAMEATPNTGVNCSTAAEAQSYAPVMKYSVNFVKTGTHYIWLRANSNESGNDDSIHGGLDGLVTAERIELGTASGWTWTGNTKTGRATLSVPSTGVHTFYVFMREDGARVDKIVLTVNSSYTPVAPTISSKSPGVDILKYWNKNTPEELELYEAAFAILSSDKDASFEDLVSNNEFMECCQRAQVKLLGGPLLGAVSSTGASIWVRSVKPSKIEAEVTDGKNKFRSAPVSSSFDSDLSAVLKFETLKPLTSYAYKLIINDTLEVTNASYSFKTLPAETDRTDVRIAFGSCFHRSSLGNEPFYQTISSTNPSAMLLLGDIAVQDRNNKTGLHRADYLLRDFHPAWKNFVCKVPVFATWDDHDYYGDDKAGIPEGATSQDRDNIRKVFCSSWNNPSCGIEGKGVCFRTRIGPCDVIMLDERYFRTGQIGSFLGEQQMDWLKNQLLDCKGPFIILSCGTMWSDYVSAGKDSWGVWDPEGREALFKFIEDNNISGVLLISGDRHGARGFTIPRESGFTFYEFEAASLGGRSAESESIGIWDTELYGIVGVFAFGEFTFTTSTSVPEVTFRLIKQGGDVIYKKTLTVDELTPRKSGKVVMDTPPMATWIGKPVQLNITVTDDGISPVTLLWTSSDPNAVFSPSNTAEDPTVTMDYSSGRFTVTVTVSDSNPLGETDSASVDIYCASSPCEAGRIAGLADDYPTDIVPDCKHDLEDLAELAKNWLIDYTLTTPIPIP